MRALLLLIAGTLSSCLFESPPQAPIERAGQAVAQCLNILNENQGVYKNGNLLTFVMRGRDPACRYILKDNIFADTIDATYYRGNECQEHFSNAYVLFQYRIFTKDRIRVSLYDGVEAVGIGLGGGSSQILEKGSLQFEYDLSVNDSFPAYTCSP